MKTNQKASKPGTKTPTSRKGGGGGKTRQASGKKAAGKAKARRRRKAAKLWTPRRRISEKEVAQCCKRIVRGLDRERRRCGISLDDVAGPAGVTRQCLGMVLRRKGSSYLSTIVRYFYALELDWSFVCFVREGAEKQGSAGGGRGKRSLRSQIGRGCASVGPCHRNR